MPRGTKRPASGPNPRQRGQTPPVGGWNGWDTRTGRRYGRCSSPDPPHTSSGCCGALGSTRFFARKGGVTGVVPSALASVLRLLSPYLRRSGSFSCFAVVDRWRRQDNTISLSSYFPLFFFLFSSPFLRSVRHLVLLRCMPERRALLFPSVSFLFFRSRGLGAASEGSPLSPS